jgi:hypothetical protein
MNADPNARLSASTPANGPSPAGRPLVLAFAALTLVGAGLCLAAIPTPADRARLATAWLVGFALAWSIGLGCLFFLALHYLTHAAWSVVVKRVAEVFASSLWLAVPLFIPVAFAALRPDWFGSFHWLTDGGEHSSSGRGAYLNPPMFLARSALYLVVWLAFARYFVSRSLRQDAAARGQAPFDSQRAMLGMRRIAGPFMVLFAFTATFASIDWLMSLEPKWSSTIFGVYIFAGMTVTGLAVMTLATLWLRRTGRIARDVVRADHLYNFGGLTFAFVCFWAYIGFSQYMLIWYANMPEESFYMVQRLEGGWLGVSICLVLVKFGVPFLVLLSRRAKAAPAALVAVAVLLLFGQWLDLYWVVMPAYHDRPVLGWQDLGPPMLMVGLLGLHAGRFLARHPAVAAGDPMFQQSREFHL